jgi:hypothetical protein
MLVAGEQEVRSRRRCLLRDSLVLCGTTPPSGLVLNQVLSECPDVDLALTALTMNPRPRWVEDLAGSLSRAGSA